MLEIIAYMVYNARKSEVYAMLFRKKITRSCSYCKFSTKFSDSQVLCIKKGIVNQDKACRKFSYDPCKRIPLKVKALDFNLYSEEDFSL